MDKLNQEVTVAILNAETVDRDMERLRLRAIELWERVLNAEQALVNQLPEDALLARDVAERGVTSARERLEELRHAGR